MASPGMSPSAGRERGPYVMINLPPLPEEAFAPPKPKRREKAKAAPKGREVETPKGQRDMTFEDLERKVEVVKVDPNEGAAESIRQLKSNKEVASQTAGIDALKKAIKSIFDKLKKKKVDITKIKDPSDLKKALNEHQIILNTLPEKAAMENLPRLWKKAGPTQEAIKVHWEALIDPTKRKIELIRNLDGNKPLKEQQDGVDVLEAALVSIVAKMTKAEMDTASINKPSQFKKVAEDADKAGKIKLDDVEKEALKHYPRIVFGSGPTAIALRETWPDTVGAGQEASKEWPDKYMEYLKKKPVTTVCLSIAAAATAVIIGQTLWEFGKGLRGSENADTSQERESVLLKKRIWIPILIAVTATFLGSAKLEKMLLKAGLKVGEVEEITEAVKKGKELTAEQKAAIEKASPKIQAEVESMQREQKVKGAKEEDATEETEVHGGISPENKEKAKAVAVEIEDEALEAGKYETPIRLLIKAHCFDRFDYPPKDVDQIRRVMMDVKGKKVSEVLALWEQEKHQGKQGKIAHKSSLMTFKNFLEEKNIYMGILILGESTEEYKKRHPEIDYSKITLEEFYALVEQDSVRKINDAVQDTLIKAVETQNILDLRKLKDIDLSNIDQLVENMGAEYVETLAADYEIDLKEINKVHFVAIIHSLYRNATLQMDAETAMEHMNLSKYDPKAVEAAKTFYEKVRERTRNKIIPAAVKRFNLDENMVREKSNANIIKNELNEKISFKRAIQLSLVTRSMDFDQEATTGSTAAQELAFLFTVLNSIPPEHKARYIPELAILLAKSPTNIKLPSLALIQPYFQKVIRYAIKRVETELKGISYWLSAFMPNRSPEAQQQFLREMREADGFSFAAETGTEAIGGAIEVCKDVITPLIDTLGVTVAELGQCEDAWDFILLVKKAGGTFIYSKDENGEPRGMIHVAGDLFWFRPTGIIKETFDAGLDGDLPGMFKVWTAGAAPFVTLGAIRGFIKTAPTSAGRVTLAMPWRIKNAIVGGAKGFAYPYYALRTTYRAAKYTLGAAANIPTVAGEFTRRPGIAVRQAARRIVDIGKYRSPWSGQNVANMMENGKWLKHYHLDSEYTKLGIGEKLKLATQDPLRIARRLSLDFNTRMTLRYANRFAIQYNDFFQLEEGHPYRLNPKAILEGDADNVQKSLSRFNRMKTFFSNTSSYDEAFEEMLKISRRGHATMTDDLVEQLKRMKGIEHDEAVALAKRLHSAKDIERLQKRMKSGIDMARGITPKPKPNVAQRLLAKLKRAPGVETPTIARVTGEIATGVHVGGRVYRFMGTEVKLSLEEIDQAFNAAQRKNPKVTRQKIIDKLCQKKWSTPQLLKEGPQGRTYSYRGGQFTLKPGEFKGRGAKEIAAILDAHYAQSIKIADVRVVKGVREFKIGNQWIRPPKGPQAMEQAQQKYVEALKKAGHGFDTAHTFKNKLLLKYFPILSEALGPVVAAVCIYHLEHAKDKRKAVAETGVGLAAFWGGAKFAESKLRGWTPKTVTGNLGKGGVILLTGLATAMGLTEPVSSILDDLVPKFAGDQQISMELISLFEKVTVSQLAFRGMAKLETTILKKGVSNRFLKAIAKPLAKEVNSTIVKKVYTYASRPLMRKIAVSLGLRGAVMAGLLADDATVIGVIDDVVAIGLGVWMAKDIIDICYLAKKAYQIRFAMEAANKLPIESIEAADVRSEKAIEAAIAMTGRPMEDMNDEEIMNVIRSISDVKIRIKRQGTSGYEVYRFVKGQVWSLEIMTPEGKKLELSDEELSKEVQVGPPQEFKPWEINYKAPKEELLANYRMAILYTKNECNWTRMDYEIIDERNVMIKRLDSPYTTKVTRSGETWAVEGFSSGHTFFQAITLANLVNKVHGVLVDGKESGGSDSPFYIDKDTLMFDRRLNFWNNLDVVSGKNFWLQFYDKIGIHQQTVLDTLNQWYQLEYVPTTKG